MWKAFRALRQHTKRTRFSKYANAISGKLFIFSSYFKSALLEVVDICLSFDQLDLFDFSDLQNCQLESFNDSQASHLQKMDNAMRTKIDRIIKVLEECCLAVCDKDRLNINADITTISNSDDKFGRLEIRQLERSREQKREQLIAVVNREMQHIGVLLRVCQNIVVEHLVQMIMFNIRYIHNQLDKQDSGLFALQLSTDSSSDDFLFTPDLGQTTVVVQKVIQRAVDAINRIPLILSHPPFLKFFKLAGMDIMNLVDNGPSLHRYLALQPDFAQYLHDLPQVVEKSYVSPSTSSSQSHDLPIANISNPPSPSPSSSLSV
eukprot:TRINITY_DN5252_c1_g1_i1.p1 TRINITY_DN5252_c1_g1~~TRINITY_DN5252_c1_g1_i1.p1  ORF type:complete len:328 (+),score=94.80 TRINITY_DN5252_c1_g1_i1:28-984(+)